ncbi:MAG: TetR/AcrR family transcriptional regulator [Kofleriaceae bacterium]
MVVSRKNGTQRRDEILDAALDCFVQKGVLATGIEDIRKAAQASPSSIYHQFDGIAEIVIALVERTAAVQYTQMAEVVAKAPSFEAAVRGLVETLLAWTFAHEKEARFMYQAFAAELGPERKRLEAAKHGRRAPLEAALSKWTDGTPLQKWSHLELSVLLSGATHQACRFYLTGQAIDRAWMMATLPTLAWENVASVKSRKPTSRKKPR